MPERIACQHDGCAHAARWAVSVRVPALGWSLEAHTPLSLVMPVKLCRDHFAELTPATFVTDDIRKRVAEVLSALGRTAPDFERAWLEHLPLDHPEVLQLDASAAGKPH